MAEVFDIMFNIQYSDGMITVKLGNWLPYDPASSMWDK